MACSSCKRRFGEHDRLCVVRQIEELFMDVIIDIATAESDPWLASRLHTFIDLPSPSTPIKEAI